MIPWTFVTPWTIGSFVHGICQAKIMGWVVIFFSRGSSQLTDPTPISCIGKWILYHWVTREAHMSGLMQNCEFNDIVVEKPFLYFLSCSPWGHTPAMAHILPYPVPYCFFQFMLAPNQSARKAFLSNQCKERGKHYNGIDLGSLQEN